MGNNESKQAAVTAVNQEGLSDVGRQILAAAGVRQEPAAGGGAQAADAQQQSAELEVDVGGVKRTVKMDDLVAAYKNSQQLSELDKLTKTRLAEIADIEAINQMRNAINSMSVTQRARMLEVLQNPNLLDDETEPDDVEDSVEDVKRRFLTQQKQSSGIDPQEFMQLKQAVQALAQFANQNIEQKRQATLAETVDRHMDSFPVLKGDAAIRGLARESVLTQLTLNPQASVEQLVQSAAQKLQEIVTKTQSGLLASAGVQPQSLVPTPPKGGFNAKSMANGDIRRAALQAMRQVTGS